MAAKGCLIGIALSLLLWAILILCGIGLFEIFCWLLG